MITNDDHYKMLRRFGWRAEDARGLVWTDPITRQRMSAADAAREQLSRLGRSDGNDH